MLTYTIYTLSVKLSMLSRSKFQFFVPFTGVTINKSGRRNMPKMMKKERKEGNNETKMNCYTVPKTRHFSLDSFASVVK